MLALFVLQSRPRETTWLSSPSQPWPDTGAEEQVQEQGKTMVLYLQDTHQVSKTCSSKLPMPEAAVLNLIALDGFLFHELIQSPH